MHDVFPTFSVAEKESVNNKVLITISTAFSKDSGGKFTEGTAVQVISDIVHETKSFHEKHFENGVKNKRKRKGKKERKPNEKTEERSVGNAGQKTVSRFLS